MSEQDKINYHRITEAIVYLKEHFQEQPSLEVLAEKMNVSPFHFQRLFTDWVGVSPKKFLQYISIQHARSILKRKEISLFDAADDIGLSGTGRLHDLFVKIEGMTPGEYRDGGKALTINYSDYDTVFGKIFMAATSKGFCHLSFNDSHQHAFEELTQSFPKATFIHRVCAIQEQAQDFFRNRFQNVAPINLHVKGTAFQIKVWEALLKIPFGELSTYGDIANSIENPKASRAVGSAIGDNPIAFIIPCHRVIRATGIIGEYCWGSIRKTAMIGWEAVKKNQ